MGQEADRSLAEGVRAVIGLIERVEAPGTYSLGAGVLVEDVSALRMLGQPECDTEEPITLPEEIEGRSAAEVLEDPGARRAHSQDTT